MIVKDTGAEVLAVQCDVRKLDDVQRLVGDTLQRFGAIHILINNAGSVPSIKFTDVSDAQWYEILGAQTDGLSARHAGGCAAYAKGGLGAHYQYCGHGGLGAESTPRWPSVSTMPR